MGVVLRSTLREIRLARGLSQKQLAAKIPGLRRTDVSAIENGRLPVGPDRLARLADALEVSTLELAPDSAVEPDRAGRVLYDRQEELEGALVELGDRLNDALDRIDALERQVGRAGGGSERRAR